MKRIWNIGAMVLALAIVGANLARAEDEIGKGTVLGTIKGSDGNPAKGCGIKLYSTAVDASGTPSKKAEAVAETTTNDKGEFKIENLPTGPYRLIAGVMFKEMAMADVKIVAGKPVKAELKLQGRKTRL